MKETPVPVQGLATALEDGSWQPVLNAFLAANVDLNNTRQAYRRRIREALISMKAGALARLTGAQLADYRARLIADSRGPATHAPALAALRSFLRWTGTFGAHGLRAEVIAAALRIPRMEIARPYQTVGEKEIGKLLKAAGSARNRAIIGVLLGCELRVSEVSALDVTDLIQERGGLLLYVRQGKGRGDRTVPVGRDVVRLIHVYLRGTGRTVRFSGPLFLTHDNGAGSRERRRLSVRSIGIVLANVVERAGDRRQARFTAFPQTLLCDQGAAAWWERHGGLEAPRPCLDRDDPEVLRSPGDRGVEAGCRTAGLTHRFMRRLGPERRMITGHQGYQPGGRKAMLRPRCGSGDIFGIVAVGLSLFLFEPSAARGLTPPPQTYVLELAGGGLASAPSSSLLNPGPEYTIEFWLMVETRGQGILMGKTMTPNSGIAFGFSVDTDGVLTFTQSAGSSTSVLNLSSGSPLPVHSWNHVAAVSNGTTITLLINGITTSQGNSPGLAPSLTTIPFELGISGNYVIAIRQIRVWNTSMPEAALQSTAQTRLSGSESGLVADWPLDGGNGNNAADYGANHLDLTLTGSEFGTGYEYPLPNVDIRWIHTAVLDAGPFFTLGVPQPVSTSGGIDHLVPMDLDAGGFTDLVVIPQAEASTPAPLLAMKNDGSGQFTDFSATEFLGGAPAVFFARGSIVGDFNGDGRQDLFLSCIGEGRVPQWGEQNRLLIQTTGGYLQDTTLTSLPQYQAYSYVSRAADFRHAGISDIFVLNKNFGSTKLIDAIGPRYCLNDGTGHFTVDQSRLPLPSNDSPDWGYAAVGDFNADGSLDIVVATSGDPLEQILVNDGHGHFSLAPVSPFPPRPPLVDGAIGYDGLESGDFNGDEKPDLVGELCGGLGEGFPNCSLRLLLSNPDGTYRDASNQIPWQGKYGIERDLQSGQIQVVDVNGDGKPDILIPWLVPTLFLNTGNGVFVDASEVLPLFMPAGTSTGVFDNSGRISIASTWGFEANFVVSLNLKNFTNFDLLKPLKLITPTTPAAPAPIEGRGH